ncbi:MAG: DUF2064 domain-containing protein [Actinomycetota bacterium]|nr:DUF2064 domain-containing protein [Actinomycetota bacterium]
MPAALDPVHVTVIAKQPLPGLVKTRLCPPCTPAEASATAAAALADTLDGIDRLAALTTSEIARVLLFEGDATDWERPGWRVVPQRGDGLGDRLANGFEDLGRGLIVGMETPHVVGSLGAALEAIDAGRDAIGLATDGGYWVIGLGAVDRRVFDGVPMSRSHTGLTQLRQLHSLGRSVTLLPAARDLDTFDDLVDAARRPNSSPNLRAVAGRTIAEVWRRALAGTE